MTIISAAHCFQEGQSMNKIYIMAGSYDRYSKRVQIRKVMKGIWNEKMPYNYPVKHNNDFVLLKLTSPLKFNKKVQPACLPNPGDRPKIGLKCLTSGWGATKEGMIIKRLFFYQVVKILQ